MYRDIYNEVPLRHLPKHVKTYLSESRLGRPRRPKGGNILFLAAMTASDYKLVQKATSVRASTLLTEYPCFDQDTGNMILDTRKATIPRTFTSYPLSTLYDHWRPELLKFYKAYNFEWNRKSDVLVGLDYVQIKHWWSEILPNRKEEVFPDLKTTYANFAKRHRQRIGIFKGERANSHPIMGIDPIYCPDCDRRRCYKNFLPRCDCLDCCEDPYHTV